MKYLSSFRLFNEEADEEFIPPLSNPELKTSNDKTKENQYKLMQSNIKDFIQKKPIVDKIFDTIEDTKIDEELKSKVYGGEINVSKRNPYLREYESLSRLGNLVKNIQNSILDDKDQVDDSNRNIQELRRSSIGVTDSAQSEKIKSQVEKNEEYIKRIKDNISMNKSKLPKLIKDLDKKKKDFSDRIKIDSNQIKNYMVDEGK